jgi:AcrR family transcriptional regulator
MAGSAAHRSPAVDKREAILAAALELFAERSFNGTPMPLVAERAGVGAGTIYRYFESKEALGNAVFRACKLAAQRELLERSRQGRTTREQFGALWRGLFEFFTASPAAFRFLETHNHASYLDDASRAAGDAVFASITDFVRRAQLAGAIRPGSPAVLIAMAFGAFIGLVKEAEMGRFELTAALVADAEPLVWAMLSPQALPRRPRSPRRK